MPNRDTPRTFLLYALLAISAAYYVQRNVFIAPQMHRNDFQHLYIGAFLVGQGIDLYDFKAAMWTKNQLGISQGLNPFVYPPFMAVLCRPLAWVDYETAWIAWCIFNHLLLVGTLALFCLLWSKESLLLKWTAGITLFAFFDPIFRTLSAGQFNIVLLFSFTLALLLMKRNYSVAAGIVIGIMASAKVAPALLLVLFLFIDRPAFFAGLATVCACTGWAVAVAGWDQHRAFFDLLPQMSYGRSTWTEYGQVFHVEAHNQAPSALFYRLFSRNPRTAALADLPTLAYALSVLTALLLLGIAAYAAIRRRCVRDTLFILWVYPMLLIPSLCWDHYFTQLLLPIWVLAARWKDDSMKNNVLFAIAVGTLAVPYAFESGWWKAGIGIFGASLKCYAAIALYLLTFSHCGKGDEMNGLCESAIRNPQSAIEEGGTDFRPVA
ncbi:MAG TPA: glycosyltransferase family 87 protein [bacterium]|nr:glycosyltransferase family 87 protein [bacterium]